LFNIVFIDVGCSYYYTFDIMIIQRLIKKKNDVRNVVHNMKRKGKA